MFVLTVFAESLAVVGEQNDQRAVVDPELLELGDQLADHVVGGGDLAVVGGLALGRKRRRRGVRSVRFVEMEEEQKRLVGVRPQPGQDPGERFAPGTLQLAEPRLGAHLDLVVVEVEAGGDPRPPLQHVRRHRAAGGVAPRLQELREVRLRPGLDRRLVERIADVVAHPGGGGQEAGEDRGVRRQGQRHVGVGVGEQDGVAAQGVDRRRFASRCRRRPADDRSAGCRSRSG